MFRCLVALLILTAAQVAVANVDTSAPVGGKPYEEQLNGGNEKFLMELKRRVEGTGFTEVDIVPSMFVMTAKNRAGQNVALVVDSDTLEALQIGGNDDASASSCVDIPKALRQKK